jgi:hypothetical protein
MPRNTRSAFTDAAGNNRTATHLSTNIIIKVGNFIVGAVQSLNVSEKRRIKMIDEIGTDGHIDSAPQASTDITVGCNRMRFDGARIAQAFGRPYLHVHAQRIPFDIEIHDQFASIDTNNAIITTIKNCWITSISYNYQATDFTIAETMDLEAEGISSVIASTNGNVVTGVTSNQEGIIVMNQFEQEADRGKYRGSMDAPGVLNAFLEDPIG